MLGSSFPCWRTTDDADEEVISCCPVYNESILLTRGQVSGILLLNPNIERLEWTDRKRKAKVRTMENVSLMQHASRNAIYPWQHIPDTTAQFGGTFAHWVAQNGTHRFLICAVPLASEVGHPPGVSCRYTACAHLLKARHWSGRSLGTFASLAAAQNACERFTGFAV